MHVYIHIYVHTYTHTYIHTYIHTYKHAGMHAYIHTYTHTYIHTHIHTYKHKQYICACVRACVCVRVCACTCLLSVVFWLTSNHNAANFSKLYFCNSLSEEYITVFQESCQRQKKNLFSL